MFINILNLFSNTTYFTDLTLTIRKFATESLYDERKWRLYDLIVCVDY